MEAWRNHHVRGRSGAALDVVPLFAALIPGDQLHDVSVAEIGRSGMRPATGAAALRMSRSRSGMPSSGHRTARASILDRHVRRPRDIVRLRDAPPPLLVVLRPVGSSMFQMNIGPIHSDAQSHD